MSSKNAVFIFRRDLRHEDNNGLNEALADKGVSKVLPIFILTPEQLDVSENRFKSDHAVQFMMESLEELDAELRKKGSRLFLFYGTPAEVIEDLLRNPDLRIGSVWLNNDYTPYSRARDADIAAVCDLSGVVFNSFEDALLNPVGSIVTGKGTVYSKFTPYWRKAKEVPVPRPRANTSTNDRYFGGDEPIDSEYSFNGKLAQFYEPNPQNLVKGGRQAGLRILDSFRSSFKSYNDTRDTPSIPTTHLSAYNKFGCVSIREVYWAVQDRLGPQNELSKQLYWRDFYYNILWDTPELLEDPDNRVSLKPKYDRIVWESSVRPPKEIEPLWTAWKEGKTGFPLIDAGMRQMNTSGFMHNRVRMNVASFLIKLLMIDWRWGEEYFAQTLLDYDPAVNNGNWQWVSGSGADAQQYNRIFNPWAQSKKHDPDASYIHKWVPELRSVPANHIHKWDKHHSQYPNLGYPAPIIDYTQARARALDRYKVIFEPN